MKAGESRIKAGKPRRTKENQGEPRRNQEDQGEPRRTKEKSGGPRRKQEKGRRTKENGWRVGLCTLDRLL